MTGHTEQESIEEQIYLASAGRYVSYLWLGHCIYNQTDYRKTAFEVYEDDIEFAESESKIFEAAVEQAPARILVDQLVRIVNTAQRELSIRSPLTGQQRYTLQAYLGGEVTTRGTEQAYEEGLIQEDPDLALISSPLRDSNLIEGISRYKRCGRMSVGLLQMGRLLPGYPAIIR